MEPGCPLALMFRYSIIPVVPAQGEQIDSEPGAIATVSFAPPLPNAPRAVMIDTIRKIRVIFPVRPIWVLQFADYT